MSRRHIYYILLLSFLIALLPSSLYADPTEDSARMFLKAIEDNPDDITAYKSLYSLRMRSGNYSSALEYASDMLSIAHDKNDTSIELQANSYIGQAYLALDRLDSASIFLNKGLDIWAAKDSSARNAEDYESIFTILNALGIYTVNTELNYEKGINYFIKGLKLAENRDAYYNYAILGSNLVMTYYKRKDTSGIQYALDIYNYGKRSNEEYVYYTGSYITALMYYLKNDLDSAENYITQIISLSQRYFNTPSVYCLYANILMKRGDFEEAGKYYRKAIEIVDEESPTSASEIFLSYGKYMLSSGNIKAAELLFHKGIDICDKGKSRVHKYELLELLSAAQETEKRYHQALETYKQFHIESYDIFNLERERAINNIQRKYEQERHEKELQQQNAILQKKKRELQIAALIIIFVIVCLLIIYLMYRNKDRMYTKIAKQYKDALTQRALQEKNAEDKNSELFARLEEVMKTQKLYLEKNLTRERAAEMIGSNRTYLSQMINEKTGMSFVHYVNNYRLNEAIEILSDPENNTPMKALSADLGFSSPSTFYKLFLEKVGMSPAKYREKIIELSKNVN